MLHVIGRLSMSKLNILHVEDSEIDQKIVQSLFLDDYVVTVPDEKSALLEIEKAKFDLVLLDLNLKDSDGLELCQKIKSNSRLSELPVMILSSRSEVGDKVLGFEFGADDYVQKPFHLLELKARVNAIRKRSKFKKAEVKISYGPFSLLLDSFKVEIRNDKSKEVKVVDLTNIEFKLMYYFISNKQRILTRQEILNHVWGQDITVIDRTVDAKISSLRKKLSPNGESIQSIYGVGYKFSINQ